MAENKKKAKITEIYSLLFIDVLVTVLACYISINLRRILGGRNFLSESEHAQAYVYLVIFTLLYNICVDGNREFFRRGYYVELVADLKYSTTIILGFITVMFISRRIDAISRLTIIFIYVFHLILVYAAHMLFKKYMLVYYRKGDASSKVMIISTESTMAEILDTLVNSREWSYQITHAAVLRDIPGEKPQKDLEKEPEKDSDTWSSCGVEIVRPGSMQELNDIIVQLPLDEAFVCLPGYGDGELAELIENIETMGMVCHLKVDFAHIKSSEKLLQYFGEYAVVSYSVRYMDARRLFIKRCMDIAGALVGLAITAVLTPFVALAIKLESRGPVFFSQERVGKNGRRFKIYKFRSMYADAEARKKDLEDRNEVKGLMFKMENDPRVTKVGRFIRKTSIDELPQFFNILAGQMSLVGTRPPTVDEFERYSPYHRRRLSIKPGLTGMWQVSGRSEITDFDQVVKLDLEYIDNWSLGLDVKLLCKTVFVVIFGRGAK